MKKTALVLLLTLSLGILLCGCGENIDITEPQTYVANGLEVTLPLYMRMSHSENFDIYLDNLSVAFCARHITEDDLATMELGASATAKEYVETLISMRKFDKSKIHYEEYPEKGQYTFRYIFEPETGEASTSCYVVVTGDVGNIWYVEMACANDLFEDNLGMFNDWRGDIVVTERVSDEEWEKAE